MAEPHDPITIIDQWLSQLLQSLWYQVEHLGDADQNPAALQQTMRFLRAYAQQPHPSQVQGHVLTTEELHLIRRWYEALQQTDPAYGTPEDDQLAAKIYTALGGRGLWTVQRPGRGAEEPER